MRKILLIFLFTSNNLLAFCIAPSPPFGGPPSKPRAPYCVNEYSRTHTCDNWEIDAYENELRNYRYDIERFVDDLQDYLREAQDYVNCEIRNLG